MLLTLISHKCFTKPNTNLYIHSHNSLNLQMTLLISWDDFFKCFSGGLLGRSELVYLGRPQLRLPSWKTSGRGIVISKPRIANGCATCVAGIAPSNTGHWSSVKKEKASLNQPWNLFGAATLYDFMMRQFIPSD